jgi:hypothetical protein
MNRVASTLGVLILAVASAAMAQGQSKAQLYPPIELGQANSEIHATTDQGVTVITNSSGQFTLQRAADQKWLLYPSPSTTYLSINIDGTVYTNLPGGGLNVTSQSGTTFVFAAVNEVIVTETLVIDGNALRCEVTAQNTGTSSHNVQARFLLDTEVDDNDGAPLYTNGITYTAEVQFIPPASGQWESWRRPDDQTVKGVGTLNVPLPAEIIFAHWPRAFVSYWSYTADPNELFYTPGYTTSPQSDSAVLVYLVLGQIAPQGQATQITWYGVDTPASGDARGQVVNAFMGLGAAVSSYQNAAIKAFSTNDVGYAQHISNEANIKQTALGFAEDLVADGTLAYIVGKMTQNTASATALWLDKRMIPQLSQSIATSGATFITAHVQDWVSATPPITTEPGIDCYLTKNMGATLDDTTNLATLFSSKLPSSLPPNFSTQQVVQQLNNLKGSFEVLSPSIGQVLESDVYWALPGSCSLQPLGNLDPILLGVSSFTAQDASDVGLSLSIADTFTTLRRNDCMLWVGGGGVAKVIASATVAGAPPAEALYWGGVGVCSTLGDLDTALTLLTDGNANWRQFEDLNSLNSDVRMTHDFLSNVSDAIVEAASGSTGCSTQVMPGNLSIPDVSSGWSSGFAAATGALPFNNYGSTEGVARTELNVYGGPNYSQLVLHTADQEHDQPLAPNSSSLATFNFQIPAGNLLFTDHYYAEARVIGSSGTTTRNTTFRACYPTACFFNDLSQQVMNGAISAGQSVEQTVIAGSQAVKAEFVMGFGGSDLDLHIYDSGGRHVGFNYETGQIELGIPGSTYSGSNTRPEVITVPLSGSSRSFTIKVVAIETLGAEDFSVFLTNESLHPATLVASPPAVDVFGFPGASAGWDLTLGETGGQQDVTNLSVGISDLKGPGGTIPSTDVVIDPQLTTIPAGTQATAHFGLTLPNWAAGSYAGQILLSSNAGTQKIPVVIDVTWSFIH